MCNKYTILLRVCSSGSDWPVALSSVRCCVRLLQCIRGNSAVQFSAVIGGSVACRGLQQVSLHLQCYSDSQLLPAVQLMMLLLLNWAVSLQVHRNLLPSFPVCPVLYQSWSAWKHSGHSPWYLQSAWALHALMTARGIACRTAWFGDWHASLWTLNLPHESTENW